jgi:hypothetical protein
MCFHILSFFGTIPDSEAAAYILAATTYIVAAATYNGAAATQLG